MENQIVIVGASVAAGGFIEEIRDQGFDGSITIIEQEPEAPYDRPPLSKQYLRSGDDEFITIDWDDFNVEIVRAKATGVNPQQRTVLLEDLHTGDASTMTFGSLVIASGANPARLPFEPSNTHVLRTVRDARDIREAVVKGLQVVILGAGAIGVETASTLSGLGAQVTVLDRVSGPLERLLGGFLQEEITGWLHEIGVETRWDTNISAVEQQDHTWEIEIDQGEILTADMVLSAVGSKAAVSWLKDSDLLTDRHLLVDDVGQVIVMGEPIKNVFAIGDAASRRTPEGMYTRTESWTAAREQGQALGEYLMTGAPKQPSVPYFWTEVAGRNVQVVGQLQPGGNIEEVNNNPARKSHLYRVDNPDGSEAWVGINAQPKIAQLMMREAVSK